LKCARSAAESRPVAADSAIDPFGQAALIERMSNGEGLGGLANKRPSVPLGHHCFDFCFEWSAPDTPDPSGPQSWGPRGVLLGCAMVLRSWASADGVGTGPVIV